MAGYSTASSKRVCLIEQGRRFASSGTMNFVQSREMSRWDAPFVSRCCRGRGRLLGFGRCSGYCLQFTRVSL